MLITKIEQYLTNRDKLLLNSVSLSISLDHYVLVVDNKG